jgi:hypothetical protein
MFEHDHLDLYLISGERAREWMREIMGEESVNTVKSDTENKRQWSLRHNLLSIFKNRKPSAHAESFPEILCCQQ